MPNALRVWKFQRFALIVEYAERRTFLFPPFSLIQHGYFFFLWVYSKIGPCEEGLKRFSNINFTSSERMQINQLENSCSIQVMRKIAEELECEQGGAVSSSRLDELENKMDVTKEAIATKFEES